MVHDVRVPEEAGTRSRECTNCGVREMNPSALLTQFSHLPFPVLLLELMEMDFCNRAVKCQLVSFGPSFNGIS